MLRQTITVEPCSSPQSGGASLARQRLRAVIRVTSRLNVGGIARHVTWLTAGLREHGFETTLVAGSVPPGEDCMLPFAQEHGVEPLVLPQMSREISWKDLLTVWQMYRLLVREKPAIVHSHAAKAGTVARLAGALYRWMTPSALWGQPRPLRMVHTFHGHVFHGYFGPWKSRCFTWIEKLLARLTDRIIVISPQQRREIHETFGVGRAEQIQVVPLGIDLDHYANQAERRQELRRELQVGADQVLVGIVGRLTEIKDHAFFLRAIALYLKQNAQGRPGHFVIIGDGHLRPQLEAQARQLGLTNYVRFLGMRDDPEVFYPGLDVVALTSRNEGTPLTLIEAMANGRPVIATNVGGVVDLLGPLNSPTTGAVTTCEHGILVPPQDENAFALGLAQLIADAGLRDRLGRAGECFIHAHYSKERLLADLADLYEQLLTSPAGKEGGKCVS